MTIKECIDIVDNIKPNQYSTRDKVQWLSFIDEIIINDVLKTHEGYDGRYDDFAGYTEDKLSVTLIVPSPYDRLYTAYLKMRIDGENGETARYNNSAAEYNSYMMEYRKHYNKTHLPLDVTKKRVEETHNKQKVGVSEAELEYLKRELYYLLSNDLSEVTSRDKIYDIIKSFVDTNIAMLKGKDGLKGEKGEQGDKGEKGDSYILTDRDKREIANMLEKDNKITFVTLLADKWQGEASPYSQSVEIAGTTQNSRINLNPSVEQLTTFYQKDITFVVGNNDGNITVYCIGQKPENDYTMQVSITEVVIDG